MKTIQQFSPVLLIALLSLLNTHCSHESASETDALPDEKSNEIQLSEQAVKNLDLDTQKVSSQEIRQRIRIQGELVIDEHRLAMIPTRISGVIESIAADVGEPVSEGQTLLGVSSQELADRIMGYVETERVFQASMVDLDRERKLREKQISSEEQFLAVERAYHSAMNAHSVALQRLRLLGYEESQLHSYMDRPDLQDMTHYMVTAPISGEVLERYVNVGNAVEPGDAIYKIADLRQLWLTFPLPMRYRNAIEEGLELTIYNESLKLSGSAKISMIEDIMDPRSRTIGVRAIVPNPDGIWMPGMPTRVELEGLGTQVEKAVPVGAIQEIDGRTVVFVETLPNHFVPQSVTLGQEDEAFVELIEGPAMGSEVVTQNTYLLKQAWEDKE